MRFQTVKRLWTLVAALAALVLVASACDLKPPPNGSTSPSSSPLESPSTSPSAEATPVAITSLNFHAGEVTVAYTPVAMGASGGTSPYQWTVSAGALPGGLTMSSGGSVSGTPTAAGTFTFTVHLADTGGRTTDVGASINIAAAPQASLTPGCAQYCAVEQGCDSTCGSFGTVSGGTAPFSYTLQGGYVPKGVSLSGLALVGTFTSVAKFWQFTVLVTDALGATTTISPTFYVYPHLSVSDGICNGFYGQGCTASLPYSGGMPGGTPTVSITNIAPPDTQGCYPASPAPQPPAGYSVVVGGGTVTVTIPGNIGSGYGAVWALTLADPGVCSASSHCLAGASVSIRVACG